MSERSVPGAAAISDEQMRFIVAAYRESRRRSGIDVSEDDFVEIIRDVGMTVVGWGLLQMVMSGQALIDYVDGEVAYPNPELVPEPALA